MADLEEAITLQRDEWRRSIERFEMLWRDEGLRLPRNRSSAVGGRGASGFTPLRLTPEVVETNLAELQATIDQISDEVESDLRVLKQRWEVPQRCNAPVVAAPRRGRSGTTHAPCACSPHISALTPAA